MDDIRTVLSKFKVTPMKDDSSKGREHPTHSLIPDIFFDIILLQFKLTKSEIVVLMYLYRQVWSKPNPNAKYGIGPLQSLEKASGELRMSYEELLSIINHLEKLTLLQTVRSGQYFIRKFFTEEFDLKYGQSYDEFF